MWNKLQVEQRGTVDNASDYSNPGAVIKVVHVWSVAGTTYRENQGDKPKEEQLVVFKAASATWLEGVICISSQVLRDRYGTVLLLGCFY